ncbi:MAG: hypothetical protein KDD33_06865 [Bdellovibrionales bacterium]|nr:hypothetical protein [Bdellovibrionales bacterium]
MISAKIWHKKAVLFTIAFTLLFVSSLAQAKVFRNSYVSFELPPKWDCYLENTAWVCRFAIEKSCLGPKAASKTCEAQRKKTKEAIIILTAKEVGPKDSFKGYYDHLKQPRPIVTRKGHRATSKIIHVKPVSISEHKWVDGMHLGSEIPHYYTRYLATIKGNIAVLVTFSAHKLFYSRYSSHFFRAIKSLRVTATKASTVKSNELRRGQKGTLGVNIDAHLGEALDGDGEGFDGEMGAYSGDGTSILLLLAAFLLLAVGGFIWWRGRR